MDFLTDVILIMYRPQILLLTKLNHMDEIKYPKLLQLVSQLKAGKGLTMVTALIEADYSTPEQRLRIVAIQEVRIRKNFKLIFLH